jgi:glucose/arabinose dehydrogenase
LVERLCRFRAQAILSLVVSLFCTASSEAQPRLRGEWVATGLDRPVDFVQDPSDPTLQFIVQHDGRIRVLKDRILQPGVFLDLSDAVLNEGERGLLGLAFPPDHASTGRFYVSFSARDTGEGEGHTIVARFQRADPLTADPSSRFDLRWSSGERLIRQPFELHRGGHLAFGPDGYLYVATGDGGADGNDAGDPLNRAQDLGSLLGKMLRIDVNVDASNQDGFVVPPGNPFVGTAGAAPEIWSIGFRNPWRFSFDPGTGALVLGDVGHDRFEEIDYEPAARPGRNYGWRVREGSHDYDVSLPPAFLPLQEPLLEFDRSSARSITGGFVYRGLTLGPEVVGRYFFGDYVLRRVYSIALTLDPVTGEATASDLRDHTAEIGAPFVGNISSFGVDAAGELYIVNYRQGTVVRLGAGQPLVSVEGATFTGSVLQVRGWAADRRASTGAGVGAIHVYAYPDPGSGAPPFFLGARTAPFDSRPDVAALYGPQFQESGFQIDSPVWIPPGPTLIVVFAQSTVTGLFDSFGVLFVPDLRVGQFLGWVDHYPAVTPATVQPIPISGWAIDPLVDDAPASVGTGIGQVLIDIYSISGAFIQTVPATTGLARADVAVLFGARFHNSGFYAALSDLRPGRYRANLRYWMTGAGRWETRAHGEFEVGPGPMIAIDAPVSGSVPAAFVLQGWAADLRATGNPGVDTVHVYAYPNPGSGTPPVFLGVAEYGFSRPDVGAIFGPAFTNSGYAIGLGPLAPGTYDLVAFAHSTVTGTFPINRVVRVTVN